MENDRKKSIDEKIKDIIERSADFQDKFTYYILAINAACIGFAISYNKNAIICWTLIPFGIALIFWLLSFHYGIRELRITDIILIKNQRFLVAQRFNNQKLENEYLEQLRVENDKIAKVSKLKVRFVYAGVIAFLLWYFLKILIK